MSDYGMRYSDWGVSGQLRLAPGGGFTGTPNVGFGLSQTAGGLRLVWRLAPAGTGYDGFEFRLDTARREAVKDNDPEHRVGFGITSCC